jgi:hypothetical protein
MTTTPSGQYDPATLFHWLWWKVQCLQASPQEFQSLFEKVAKRVRPDFIRVRPYGHIGDRKCDGLYWGDGTVFQVYSPDELRQQDTLTKIEVDLEGAVEQWGEKLKRWVFVYNTRRGVGPDIARILLDKRREHPEIEIEPLDSDALWELARTKLTLQQRVEILGAPAGYEGIFLRPGTAPEEIARRLREGRFVVVHDVLSPINIMDAVAAMKPDTPFGPPLYVSPPNPHDSWQLAAEAQQEIVNDALRRSQGLLPRFAVFSLAPIPLAIHLGHLFSDRVEVQPFQYNREHSTWCWSAQSDSDGSELRVDGLPEARRSEPLDVVIRVSISAEIAPADTIAAVGACPIEVDLRIPRPDIMWLDNQKKLRELGRSFRSVLRDVLNLAPGCRHIHLFYAGPTGGGVVIGQAINPRMVPETNLYEFNRQQSPRYEHVLTLK